MDPGGRVPGIKAKDPVTSMMLFPSPKGPEELQADPGALLSLQRPLLPAELTGTTGINISIYLSINIHIFSYIYLFF